MISSHPSRLAGWFHLASALAALAVHQHACAQTQPTRLETVVVSTTRTPQELNSTPSSVSLLSLTDFNAAQIGDLRTALSQTPGLFIANTGATGGQSAIFMRGASSHQTLLVVDGIRMNDREALYQNFLGGADLAGLDRVEVLRGPQGTLYGSSAMGGVILMDTAHGCGQPVSSVEITGGSFDTRGASAAIKGGFSSLGYSGSIGRLETSNDLPYNKYDQWSYSTRIEGTVGDGLSLGVSFRGLQGDYEEPGSRLYPAPGLVESDSYLATAYAQYRLNSDFTSRLTTGWTKLDYAYTSTWGTSTTKNKRRIADWQNTWMPCKAAEFVFGVDRELTENLVGPANTNDSATGLYLSGLFKPMQDVTVTLGGRNDKFSTVGTANTWRTGVAYQIKETGTTLRSSYGTGFTAPGSNDRFGVPSWGMLSNPNLVPEESRGWDLGLTQSFLEGKVIAELTYFETRYRNLFEWQTVDFTTYEGRTVNRARARAKGVEAAFETHLNSTLTARLSYTYLEATDSISDARLTRRPRQAGDVEVRGNLGKAWIVGAGLHVVADRLEGSLAMEDYTTVRVFTSYQLGLGVQLKLRVENLLDEKYEEVLGYPALPLGVYAGVEWRY